MKKHVKLIAFALAAALLTVTVVVVWVNKNQRAQSVLYAVVLTNENSSLLVKGTAQNDSSEQETYTISFKDKHSAGNVFDSAGKRIGLSQIPAGAHICVTYDGYELLTSPVIINGVYQIRVLKS